LSSIMILKPSVKIVLIHGMKNLGMINKDWASNNAGPFTQACGILVVLCELLM
jgi:hypothetical protein